MLFGIGHPFRANDNDTLMSGSTWSRQGKPKDIRGAPAREGLWKSVLEVHRRCPQGIPLLDPVDNMGITDDKFKALIKV